MRLAIAATTRPLIPIYYPGEGSRCPCCSGRQWYVGRVGAECARCAFVAPLAASSTAPDLGKPGHCNGVIICGEGKR
jgi:hypothetical protein